MKLKTSVCQMAKANAHRKLLGLSALGKMVIARVN